MRIWEIYCNLFFELCDGLFIEFGIFKRYFEFVDVML